MSVTQTFRDCSLANDLAFATLKQHSTPRWDMPFNTNFSTMYYTTTRPMVGRNNI